MTVQTFLSRLNWRQVIVHYISICFLIQAFETLALLHNTELVAIYRNSDMEGVKAAIMEKRINADSIIDLSLWLSIAHSIGFLFGMIISFCISFQRKWFWVNSLLIIIIFPLLSWLNVNIGAATKQILFWPSKFIDNFTLKILTNGLLLLSIGMVLFLLPRINRFIEKGNRKLTVKPNI